MVKRFAQLNTINSTQRTVVDEWTVVSQHISDTIDGFIYVFTSPKGSTNTHNMA